MKKKNLKLMYILNLMSEFKLYGVIAILFYINITGSMMLAMSIFSIATIASSILELPTGLISDKIGRKKTIIIGSICSLIYILILSISNNYIALVVASIFNGLEIAFFSGNNQAYIYDILSENLEQDNYNVYAGKSNSMLYLSGAISALIGSIIVFFTSYRFVIYLSILPKIIQLIISIMLKDVKKIENEEKVIEQTKNAIKAVAKNKILKEQIVADGINEGIGEACYQFRSTFYEMVWPTWALGIPGILSNIGAFISNWFGGLIIKKFKKSNIYFFSNIYSIASNIIGVIVNNLFSPLIMVSNSIVTTEVIQMEIEQKLYDSKYRASMASIKSLFKNIIFSIISICVGLVADCIGIIKAFIIFQLLKVIPIIIYKNVFKKLTNKKVTKA